MEWVVSHCHPPLKGTKSSAIQIIFRTNLTYTMKTGYMRFWVPMSTFGSFSFLKIGWFCDECSLCLADIADLEENS